MTTHWRVNQGRRRTIAVPVQTEAATRTLPGRARSFRRSKSTSSGQEHEQAKDRLELPTTASASTESAEDAKLNEILEEFERELWSHSRRLTRLQTPPKWVPPWAAAGCNPKPQVKLKPLSPVKRQRCSGPLLSRLRSKDGDDMLATVLNSLLPVPSQSSGKRRTLSPLPKEAVPLSPLCLSHERWSPSVGSPKFSVGSEQSLEVLEFLGVLTRRFGNLTRAFRAMKRAAGKGRKDYSLLPLSKAEFTWCVTSFLHHGNNTLACKLFAAMNRAEGIGLCDLMEHTPEGLLSLQQVRQQLLEEWSREELEEILQSHQQDEVSKQDFMNLAEDLGMESCQAWHLFELLEDAGHAGHAGHGGRGRGGCIGMADLREAVLSDETRLLWHDLWRQLVARFGSIRDAWRILESCVHSPECHVDEDTFSNWMESWSICREEAAEYFDFLKGAECCNSDGSNESNLLEKLKNSLHSAAPKTSLEDFWQRVAAEWPELLEAAHAKSAPGQLADLLLELLPMEMRLIMKQMRQGSRQGTPRKVSGSHKRPQVTEHSTSGNVQSQSPLSLLSLDLEAFTALAMHIDVSPENAKELFESITRSASVAQSEDVVPEAQIYLDDFAEQMILWTEGVDRRGPMKEKIQQLQHFRFAPVRAVISALKAELLPAAPPSETPESDRKATKLPKDRKEKKQRPQLPWCTYYHLRPNPVPSALT